MTALRPVLGDQLSRSLASLVDLDADNDVVLMVEVAEETTYVPHHPKKIALILSAMRHFADALRAEGVTVDYVYLDDADNAGSFRGEIERAVKRHKPARIVVTEPGEYRVEADMMGWEKAAGVPVEILADDRFLCSRDEFADWAEGRKQLRMEFFYREMRRKTGILMDGAKPVGDQWNFDGENRKSLPKSVDVPKIPPIKPDRITKDVLALVEERFSGHFGDLDGFAYAVTGEDAEALFDRFGRSGCRSSATTRTRCGWMSRPCSIRSSRHTSTSGCSTRGPSWSVSSGPITTVTRR